LNYITIVLDYMTIVVDYTTIVLDYMTIVLHCVTNGLLSINLHLLPVQLPIFCYMEPETFLTLSANQERNEIVNPLENLNRYCEYPFGRILQTRV
jgi:hypothetical protein